MRIFRHSISAKVLKNFALAIFTSVLLLLILLVSPFKPSRQKLNAQDYITGKMKNCEVISSEKCLREAAVDLLDKFTLPEIAQVLEKNETTPEYFGKCHVAAHYLGQEAYRKTKDITQVFTQSNFSCFGGLFHGAVEAYFIEKNVQVEAVTDVEIAKLVPQICSETEKYQREQVIRECNHGMGHALMDVTDNDLARTLALCDALDGQKRQDYCYTGAFMQNAQGTPESDHPSKYLKQDDPSYTCTMIGPKYQTKCYTIAVLLPNKPNVDASINTCRQVPNQYKTGCFMAFGGDRTLFSDNPQELTGFCKKIDETAFINECLKGEAYNLLTRFGYNSKIPEAFCNDLESYYRKDCYKLLGKATLDANGQKTREKFCSNIEEKQYEKDCLNN